MNNPPDLRSLRSKGNNDEEEDDRFDFDKQEYSINPDKKFTVLRSRIRDSAVRTDMKTLSTSSKKSDVQSKRNLIKRMTLTIQNNDIRDYINKVKIKEGSNRKGVSKVKDGSKSEIVIKDPLIDNVYTSFHRRMLSQENRMHQSDVNQSTKEADRLILVNDKLDMPSWVGTLQKVTIINNPHDEQELLNKKKLTKQYIKKLLDRYNKMQKHNQVLNKEMKNFKLVPIHRTAKIYQNLDRKFDVEYHSSSDDEDDENLITNEELSNRRLYRREIKSGGSIVIGINDTELSRSKFAIIAEPLRTPHVILASPTEKKLWRSITGMPKQLLYSSRLSNQFGEFKQKISIPLTLKGDKIIKNNDNAIERNVIDANAIPETNATPETNSNVIATCTVMTPSVEETIPTGQVSLTEETVPTKESISIEKNLSKEEIIPVSQNKLPEEPTSAVETMTSTEIGPIVNETLPKILKTNYMKASESDDIRVIINEFSTSPAILHSSSGDPSEENIKDVMSVSDNSILLNAVAKDILKNGLISKENSALNEEENERNKENETSTNLHNENIFKLEHNFKLKTHSQQYNVETSLSGATSSKRISKMEFASKYSNLQNDFLSSIISSVHNSSVLGSKKPSEDNTTPTEKDTTLSEGKSNPSVSPFKSLIPTPNIIFKNTTVEKSADDSKPSSIQRLHTGHLLGKTSEVEISNNELGAVNPIVHDTISQNYSKSADFKSGSKTIKPTAPVLGQIKSDKKHNPTTLSSSGSNLHKKNIRRIVPALQTDQKNDNLQITRDSTKKRVEPTQINVLQVRKKPKPNSS